MLKFFKNSIMYAQSIALCLLCLISSYTVKAQTPKFKVLAFYNGTYDAAHINFVKEARVWYPQLAAQNGFSWESTNNWSLLNASNLAQYQVVMFLDDLPPVAQHAAFQQYMQNGGAWMGHHVCAFNTDPSTWDWYHNQFLGTGAFRTNTWGPTTAVLKCEDQTHPSTLRLPTTFTSAVSEWYGWNNDLRTNPNIKILCSIDPSSFPLGSDPNQSWYSGYYPIMWTNKNYKMIYANFGHNAMDYAKNIGLSSTFASEIQNRFILDALLWLGGASATTPTAVPGVVQAESYTAMSGVQLEPTTDTGGGQDVGYIDAGDWMDYNVNVQTSGSYNVQYRIASLNGGGNIQLKSGTTTLATTTIPTTGGWQTWATTASTTVNLTAGTQTLRLQAGTGGYNINWIQFSTVTNNTIPIGQTITLKGSNNLYVSGMNGTAPMQCTSTAASTWEKFIVVDAGGGKIGLKSMSKFVSSENGATTGITCNRATVGGSGSWEQFDWIINTNGTISLRGNNGLYVSSENGTKAMTCTRTSIAGWESFTYAITTAARLAFDEEVQGMELNTENDITLSPNPAPAGTAHILTLNFNKNVGDVRVDLKDASGANIFNQSYKNVLQQLDVSLPALSRGMYIVQVKGHQLMKAKKYLVK